ncbi:MAG: hypothetical protein JRN52_03860 [Nitrososphaerota archaeon]|nr:hypothetical protein [Nitrososphaerota archaeon]
MSFKKSTIIGVAAIALVLGVALGSVAFPMTRTETITHVSTLTTIQSTTIYYGVPTVTIPVPCCANIPESFVVGSYLFNIIQYAPLPPITRNGVVTVFSAGVLIEFNVSPVNVTPKHYEQANFTWSGTFSETVPYPSNATLFGGDVRLTWFVNSLMLYLTVSTGIFCGGTSQVTTINGTTYCTDNVSSDTVVQNPGYAYFLNDSVTFMGVRFDMICQPSYFGCPGTSNVTEQTTILAGAIMVNLSFPDNTNETIGGVIGISSGITVLSKHNNPRAGVMITSTSTGYDTFLLMEASQ